MKAILTLTMNPCIDKAADIDRVEPNRKLRCRSVRYEPGGGGINVSRAIKKLGGESVACYPSGGPFGDMLAQLLDEEKIETRKISLEGWTRENIIISEETSDHQYRFGFPGPTIRESEWRQCLELISDRGFKSDYLVLSGSLPQGVPEDFYARAAARAKKIGAETIVDATGAPLSLALEEGLFLIKPNLGELKRLSGSNLEEESTWHEYAEGLVREYKSQVVVVSLGAGGAAVFWNGNCRHLRAPVVTIKSRVGAGDSMVGGMVLSLARGFSLLEAVRFGVASGAAAVMTEGTELCRREDAERLYERTAQE